ncbi:hypothetical protein DESC_720302 [Desulfosarcina cetonica]|nr:hypothetical protein DESC_720302 [Desulfosarcina cetonica]
MSRRAGPAVHEFVDLVLEGPIGQHHVMDRFFIGKKVVEDILIHMVGEPVDTKAGVDHHGHHVGQVKGCRGRVVTGGQVGQMVVFDHIDHVRAEIPLLGDDAAKGRVIHAENVLFRFDETHPPIGNQPLNGVQLVGDILVENDLADILEQRGRVDGWQAHQVALLGKGSGHHGHGQALPPQVTFGQPVSRLGAIEIPGKVLGQDHLHHLLLTQHGDGLLNRIHLHGQSQVCGIGGFEKIGRDGRIAFDDPHQLAQGRFGVIGQGQDFVDNDRDGFQFVDFFKNAGKIGHFQRIPRTSVGCCVIDIMCVERSICGSFPQI